MLANILTCIFVFTSSCCLFSKAQVLEHKWEVVSDVEYVFLEEPLFTGFTYASKNVASMLLCQEFCEATVGCSFVFLVDGVCEVKLVDQVKYTRTSFNGQMNENFLPGTIRGVTAVGELVETVESYTACNLLCNADAACQFSTYNSYYSSCQLKAFAPAQAGVISSMSYRLDPRALNDRPAFEGTFTTAGNPNLT